MFFYKPSQKGYWPNTFVESGFQIFNIQAYANGLKPGSAAILSLNPLKAPSFSLHDF